ncbi:hypothetical protein, partial [Pseudoxanthomonas daejeonensis]|uniref:hypothetical protein n=1 Tax=Pseudoxanthomonas daejeonensis TaxID=266062 RepID=UPI001EE4A347
CFCTGLTTALIFRPTYGYTALLLAQLISGTLSGLVSALVLMLLFHVTDLLFFFAAGERRPSSRALGLSRWTCRGCSGVAGHSTIANPRPLTL